MTSATFVQAESVTILLIEIGVQLSILEHNGRELWVRWVEPGRCHYGEQRWVLCTAKRSGSCALSGLPVKRGDTIFRPNGRPVPLNGDAMILPSGLSAALQHI